MTDTNSFKIDIEDARELEDHEAEQATGGTLLYSNILLRNQMLAMPCTVPEVPCGGIKFGY